MSEEITLESLDLKKPLDKMTSKELRLLAMEKIPQITGASGMGKEELVAAIKELFGISDEDGQKTSPYQKQIGGLKREIKAMRGEKAELSDRKGRDQMRRKINRLKKRTRRLAAAN